MRDIFPMPPGVTFLGELFFGAIWMWGLGFVAFFIICVVGGLISERYRATEVTHDLYNDSDKDAPDCIKDRNGVVVLGLCKTCGRGEIELAEPCEVRADPR